MDKKKYVFVLTFQTTDWIGKNFVMEYRIGSNEKEPSYLEYCKLRQDCKKEATEQGFDQQPILINCTRFLND